MGNPLPKAGQGAGPAGYDDDFYSWSQQQAALLRAMKLRPHDLDIENLATEIEDLGKRDFRSLQSHCETAVEHLLKLLWSTQAEPRAGWSATVRRSHREILLLLEDSPSLAGKLAERWSEIVERAGYAALDALAEADESLPNAEPEPPASLLSPDTLLNPDFHPGIWVEEQRQDPL